MNEILFNHITMNQEKWAKEYKQYQIEKKTIKQQVENKRLREKYRLNKLKKIHDNLV